MRNFGPKLDAEAARLALHFVESMSDYELSELNFDSDGELLGPSLESEWSVRFETLGGESFNKTKLWDFVSAVKAFTKRRQRYSGR